MGLLNSMKTKPMIITTAFVSAGWLTAYIKDKVQGDKYDNPIRATGKRVIITGATSGIGMVTAKELSKRGAHVYMACRDMKRCEELCEQFILETKNKHVHCMKCDLSSMESIRNFVEAYRGKENRLDILINNAGVMRCPYTLSKDGIEMQLGVNHLGHFLLTNLLLDMLKTSAPSRVIVVASSAHLRGHINTTDINSEKKYDAGMAYNQSKLANVLFMRELARRLSGSDVTVNAVNPGLVDTKLMRHMGIFTSWSGTIFRPLAWPFLKTAKSGAQTILFAALEPQLDKVSGLYYCNMDKCEISDEARDKQISEWLWKVSEKWTGLDRLVKTT